MEIVIIHTCTKILSRLYFSVYSRTYYAFELMYMQDN